MKPISAAELASIRSETAVAVCTESCIIKRYPKPPDGYGTSSDGSPTTVATVLAGMQEPTSGQLATYADKIGALKSWQVQFPYGTDVRVLDHLFIGSDEMVVQVDFSPQSLNALTTVLATEVK